VRGGSCAGPRRVPRSGAGVKTGSTIQSVPITRRTLLTTPLLAPGAAWGAAQIDRMKLVRRHNPELTKADAMSPLSVGNGEFAFTADLTGLQTYREYYVSGIPLCTMSQWAWHSAPAAVEAGPLRMTDYDTHDRKVGYPTGSEGQRELYNLLRENPHRLNLGRVGFRFRKSDGAEVRIEELGGVQQTLDLWTGVLESRYTAEGEAVRVETACHPELDMIGARVESTLLGDGRLEILLEFPYGSPGIDGSDWKAADRHTTTLQAGNVLERQVDGTRYEVRMAWDGEARLEQEGPHRFVVKPGRGRKSLSIRCMFSRSGLRAVLPDVFEASRRHWQEFWSRGGAVEFEGSRDPRWKELERRVVLSQYLTAIQCAGSLPPQETGLTCNSWYGKFHLEMHWWHAVHFGYWNRMPLLERSLSYYESILPRAREWAKFQGYTGARWPKMVGPDGKDSPSPIGPLLIWQQPHPIYYAELCYRVSPSAERLKRYRDVVLESAEFMASFAWLDPKRREYVLGPPVIPAQENHPPKETWNPTYELEYWRWGLETAQRWRERLGLQREPRWDDVARKLSPLPVKDGVYLAHENCPQTYTERNRDHPSMLAALGVLPGESADRETMRRTLKKVISEWKWANTWGWDYPMTAMTAARLGERETAVDALLLETPKNRYLANGHNYQRPGLHLYLPGNGGLLTAVALMAAGWEGGPEDKAPGFPKEGWSAKWEGLRRVM